MVDRNREQMGPNDSDGTGDLGRAVATSVQGGDRVPEDCGGAGVTEDPGEDGRRQSPLKVVPMGRGGVMRSAAGFTFLVEARDCKTHGFSTQQCVRVKDEGLKGTNEDGAEGLAGC